MADKSWLILTDPTSKRNMVKEPGSHPEGNLGWENSMEGKKLKKKVDFEF